VKRQREQAKREKQQLKAERRAQRKSEKTEDGLGGAPIESDDFDADLDATNQP
jgi:hypothetical protein